LTRRLPEFIPAHDAPPRRRVALLEGCVQRVFFRDVNEATARVLAREGCDVIVPRAQRCCGALSEHAGREPEALRRARRLIDVFEGAEVDAIVVNVAGCGSTMKEYGRLLRDDPQYAERAAAFSAKVRDISEVLADLDPVATRHPIEARVAYHDACHLGHSLRPRQHGEEARFAPTHRWREMDSNFRFRASSDYAGVGVLRSTWAVLTLRRRDPDWNATKRRRDSERRASTAAE